MSNDLRKGEQELGHKVIPMTFWIGEALRCFTLIGIPFAALRVVSALTNSFVVTNKRVFGKVGLFGTSEYDIGLDRVTSVKSIQGILGKMLNYGYIEVTDQSGDFYRVLCSAPTQLKKQVFEIQDKYKEEQVVNMAKAMKAS